MAATESHKIKMETKMNWKYYLKQTAIAVIVLTTLEILSQKTAYSTIEIFLSVLWKVMLIACVFYIFNSIKLKKTKK